jgi:hypothetical protein
MNYDDINKEVLTLVKLEPISQALAIRDSVAISKAYTSNNIIGTLVHEFLHALTTLDHGERASHDPVTYTIGKNTKTKEYSEAADDLWSLGMKSYHYDYSSQLIT